MALRLKVGGTRNRQIARSCGVSRPTVSDYLRLATEAGLSWSLPDELCDAALEHRLSPPTLRLLAQKRGIPG